MSDLERVRQHAETLTDENEPLDFYGAALDLGLSEDKADEIDTALNLRVMRARGAI